MKKVIKEGLIGIAIIIGVAGFFIGTQLLSNYINSLQSLQEVYCADVKTLQETYGVQVEKIRDNLRSQLETAFTAKGLTKDYVNVFMN